MILVFSSQTGGIEFILLDEGWLTDIRTTAAGAVEAKHLANRSIDAIGVVGTDVQARLQLELCKRFVNPIYLAELYWGILYAAGP